jgi:hypothetical protein
VNLTSIKIAILILLLLPFSSACSSDKLSSVLGQVESLNLSRGGYTLGKVLTDSQKATALKHPEEAANPLIFKFKDGDLHVVVDKATDRIVVLYERYEAATIKKIQALVGSLYLDFDDPTVMAHDKIIYWAFGPEGKLSEEQYRNEKDVNKKLNILATVKLNSDIKIVGKSEPSKVGDIYYIISSEPVLKLMSLDRFPRPS